MAQRHDDEVVVAAYRDRADAEAASQRLTDVGVAPQAISYEEARLGAFGESSRRKGVILLGGILGAVAGAVIATLAATAGIVPVVAGEPPVSVLLGAAIGSLVGLGAALLVRTREDATSRSRRRTVVKTVIGDPRERESVRRLLQATGAIETADLGAGDEQTRFIRGFIEFQPPLRRHFESTYHPRGETWGRYEPCYRFGWQLANRPDFAGRPWEDVRLEVRREWERRHPDRPWRDVGAAVEQGFLVMTRRRVA